jgi:CheY-like chemotaxis protein
LGHRPTVLVIEDDRATSDLIRDVVEAEGFRFVPANEGHLAVSIAIEERPDLITLDLDLPDTDGHAVLHRILADDRTRHTPIVVVTGFSRYLPDGDCHRVAAVFEKPFEIGELSRVLSDLLAAPAGGPGRP